MYSFLLICPRLLCRLIYLSDAGQIGYVLRTDILAAAAAHTHGITKPFFKIADFMENFKTHPFALVLAKRDAACDIRIAVYPAGSSYAPAFPGLWIIFIENILHGKTGTGGTDKIAAAAADTPSRIFLP